MKDWTGFWESDTHELKQIAEETGVAVDKFQDIYEAMYPNIHKWAWYNQTIKDLEELKELKESKPTAYDIAHGLKTTEDLKSYEDLEGLEDLKAEIDKLQDELDAFCSKFIRSSEYYSLGASKAVVRVLQVETPKWLKTNPGRPAGSIKILPVLALFNEYLLNQCLPGVATPVEWKEPRRWWKFWDYSIEPHEPWSPPSYINRLILAFRAYLEYQGIQHHPYLDSPPTFHHWLPPKEYEYKAKV